MVASKAQQAATAKRRAQAIALVMAGLDYDTIAERLGYADRGAASKDVWRALKANRLEEKRMVDELRDLEVRRLDRLQAAVWPQALRGDLKAVETCRRLIAERVKVTGVAEPVRTELTGPGGGPLEIGPVTAAELHLLIGTAGDPDDTPPEPATEEDDDDGNSP